MADALLSIVLTRLASVVEQQIRDELTLVLGVEAEIQSLTDTLRSIRDVLEDAERRQVKEKSVQGWLEKLKDMAYQMDDVVDEWSTAILQLQIEGAENASMSKKKVSSCIPSPCFFLKQVASRRDIALKIKGIKQQLDVIASQRSQFNFISSLSEEPQRFITTSQLDIPEVYGRDMDKNTILGHLLGETCQETESGPHIISIVGTGGMGKTTLAQLAYNLPEVKAHFDERIWVCVSDPFDPFRIFREIVEILQGESPNLHSLEALQQKIQTCIAGKKFLIVLDDVWTENHQLWGQLKSTLNCGGVGSRILATTRKESVVKMVGTTYTHSLEELSREQARTLFHQIAFFEKSREKVEELKEIGENIADKCKGLPLAIKTLGNLMRSKHNREEWENVLCSEVWKLDVFGRDISPALLLSYYDLPPAIKRCFSFCAVFPKDSVIERDELIKLWMAQSYLKSDGSKEMEMVGREYFEYLAARSFFQDFEKDDDGNIIGCKMHDIVHDFAQFFTQNECFIVEVDNQKKGSMDLFFQKIRHATLVVQESTPNFASTCNMKNLHTLLVREAFKSRLLEVLRHLTCPRALDLSSNHLTCLRALDLSSNQLIKEFPEVGKLIHLRYLNVSNCRGLTKLPETICDLYNLQTLKIKECSSLQKLPQAMGKLINLRHLENSNTWSLKGLPKGIGRLSSLQTLVVFIVSSHGNDECQIGDLRNLNNLRGDLSIQGLGEVKDAGEAEKAELKNKVHLQYLRLEFGGEEGTKGVGEALQPHPNLKSLDIFNYGDREWPNWMMGSSLAQLKILVLNSCIRCPCLPPLGQLPVLEKLDIWDMVGVKYIGSEFLGSSSTVFPKLKELVILCLDELKQWEIKEKEERSIMPCLNHLIMRGCPKLEGLPDHVLQRTTLQILNIKYSRILERRYRKDIGEDRHKISHIPEVKYSRD
ncbi:putative disease resistance protein RGA1 [Vitis riparia]|uniref:putative disease resistance protein RGA1 n=1 Tax=Vitis riparia TaxID=96939 RepID=UPI00155AEB43|nr:putative disease resistance protein RGA1 [Vitis riparia]